VGLLALALVAQLAGAAFLWLDYSSYPSTTPQKLQAAPASTPTPQPQPQPQPPPGGGAAPMPMQ
jgi:hypothetical protein